ncbi:MAG: pyruvate formate lyase family protein [Armatimonadota bacterium]
MAATATASPTRVPIGDRVARLLSRLESGQAPATVHKEAFTGAYWVSHRRPELVRLAAGIANTFRMMPAVIQPDELIVGGDYVRQIAGFSHREGIYCDEDFAQEVLARNSDHAAQMEQVVESWRGRTTPDLICADRDSKERAAADGNVLAAGAPVGSGALDYHTILSKGVAGLQAEIVSARNRLEAQDDPPQQALDLYEALLIVADGIVEFAQNHSLAARQLAQRESEPARRQELRLMAAICRRMPARPAATFHEALQSLWFVYVLDGCNSLGRIDQLLWPYLERDLASQELSMEQAQELIDCLWLKLSECAGGSVCLGGLRPDSTEGANPVTDLCLSAQERLGRPTGLTLRWRPATSQELLARACEAVAAGPGKVVLCNDDALVQALCSLSVPVEEARDYCPVGDAEVAVQGKSHLAAEAEVNLAKCLELALNDGVCRRSGQVLGPKTGNPRQFPSYYHVRRAYEHQIAHFAAMACDLANRAQRLRAETAPNLVRTLFIADCIQQARTYDAGGARYNGASVVAHGLGDAADSLLVIKRAVFQRRSIDLPTLIDALDADFQGYEELAGKIGEVEPCPGGEAGGSDEIAAEIAGYWAAEVQTHRLWRGGKYAAALTTLGGDSEFAANCGALPDGRSAGAPLAGSVGPRRPVDLSGHRPDLRAAAKLPVACLCLDLPVAQRSAEGPEGGRRLAALVRDYFSLGGQRLRIHTAEEAH